MTDVTRGTSAPEMVLVRYGELALKGKNRSSFVARPTPRTNPPVASGSSVPE